MSTPDQIWNRAVWADDPGELRDGDLALHHATQLTGLTANGGLLHAIEVLGPSGVRQALAGLRWLGIDRLADEIERFAAEAGDPSALALDVAEELEERGNDLLYADETDPDSAVEASFRARLTERPDAFAPLRRP